MKLDEDMRHDRQDEFQTDDEENQAERVYDDENDTESDCTASSRTASDKSIEADTPSWPHSYRQSMDMLTSATPPYIGFLQGTSLANISSSLTSVFRRRGIADSYSPLSEPLISQNSLDKEEVPTSTLPVKISASSPTKLHIDELPHPEKGSSFAQAVLNGINVLCGIGLLTTPYAVKEGGWLSLLILSLFGIVCCYTGTLLKKCLESSPGLQTYPDIGQAAFGFPGRLAISIVLYVELYASCVEFVIMMSDNLSSLFPDASVSFAGIYLDSQLIFPITSTFIVLPTVWLRDMTWLSYLSVGGVGTSILVAICLLWVGVVDKVGFHRNGRAIDVENLPVAVGIFGFGFSGHSVFPNIYSSMKDPSGFSIVLIVSFVFCWIMYTGVAICGFLMFGDSIKSQYTLNMPTEYGASRVAVWTAVVNPMTKYALTITPVALSLEELMPPGRLRSYSVSLVIRTLLVISTLVVGLKIPFFGFVMALIGSLLAMLVAVIFPCACYLSILHERLTKLQIAACVSIICLAAVSACLGTFSAVIRIAHQYG